MQNAIADLWSGRMPLPRAFWEYAICYGTMLNLVTTFASLAALSAGAAGLVALTLHFLPLPYNLMAVVAVWRSAENYRGAAVWQRLARLGVVMWAVVASVA